MTFADAFATSVGSKADSLALVAPNRPWTYGELDRYADGLASQLRNIDIAKGDMVWCNARDTVTRVAGLIACARIGSVLFDPPVTWSPQTRAWAWGQLKPSAVFADGSEGPVKKIGSGQRRVEEFLTPGDGVSPDDPLDVKASSETIERPQLAIRTHANHLHTAHSDSEFLIGPETTLAVFGPAFTDATVTTLGRGAALVIPATSHTDPFLETARSAGADWLMMPAPALRQWAASCPAIGSMDGFKGVLAYGVPVPVNAHQELERATNVRLVSAYSPIEAPWCTFQRTSAEEPTNSAGRPASTVKIEVHNTTAGGTGDIVVRGPNVSPGYLGEHPRSREQWFTTGDAGSLDANGNLLVYGRTDEIIDVAGKKVVPHVVETVIGQFTGVRNAVVFGTDEMTRVAAAVVAKSDTDRSMLEDHCHQHLKSHEVPSNWVFPNELPLTATGTADQSALLELV